MQKIVYPLLVETRIYIEDTSHQMPRRFLTKEAYAAAMESMVVVNADAVIINSYRRTIYLARRCVKPWKGWWMIGGRVFAGELPEDSMQRCFQRETSLYIEKDRFRLIGMYRYLWKDREQEPQSAGSDNLGYTFAVELSEQELLAATQMLDRKEYAGGLSEFDRDRIVRENVHPVLSDIYKKLFG